VKQTSRDTWDWVSVRRNWAWFPMEMVQKMVEITTQLAKSDVRLPLRRHFKLRFPPANVNRLRETFSTDTFFSSKPGLRGETSCQLFVGNTYHLIVPYGMTRESEGPTKLQDFIKDYGYGAPDCILRDNSKMQNLER